MEETEVINGDGIDMLKVGGIHGGGLPPDTVPLSFKEEGDVTGAEEELGQSVLWNYAVLIVELWVAEAELDCVSVGLRFGIFTISQE